jgi:LuxR family maltose regulon positive regulatory protein
VSQPGLARSFDHLPVIRSKLIPPPVPRGAIGRARLVEQLAVGRVGMVVAPPGYGKTVAVWQFIDATGPLVAWFDLDLLDDNPGSFWAHLIQALREILPTIDDEVELLLAERGPHDLAFLAALMAQIERDGRHGVVVLDDVSAISDRSVLDGIALMVDRVGHLLRFIIIARSDPALPAARWRSAGWLAEVREEHLRFNESEALTVAAMFPDLELSDEVVLGLHHRTEGWPGGLHLALLSIRDSPDPEAHAREVAGSDRLLADYLAAEVLDRLPVAERDVALALSVLDWFDADLCQDLIGNDAVPIAHQLQRRRLFLTTIDGHRGAMRFHPLFRELLESELWWRDPQRRDALHRRAAALWAERGELNNAYRHLRKIGDMQAASDLVVQTTRVLVDRGDRSGLAQWMHALPQATHVDSPSLALDLALASFSAGRERESRAWCDRADELSADDDCALQVRLHAYRCALSLMQGDLDTATQHIDEYERLIDLVHPTDDIDVRFATIATRVAIATRRFDDARMWIKRAQQATGPEDAITVTVPALEAWLELETGDLSVALNLADEACAQADRLGARTVGVLDARIIAAWCHLGAGDIESADRMTDLANADVDILGFTWTRIRAGVLAAELCRLTSGPRSSLEVVRQLEHRADLPPAGFLAGELDLVEAKALIGCGQIDAARRLIARQDDSPRRRLLQARVAAQKESSHAIERLLSERASWPRPERLEANVVIASVSPSADALPLLAATLAEGTATEWVSPFLDHGDAVERLLHQLPVDELHPRLAEALPLQYRPARAAIESHDGLTPREASVLELLPTYLSYAQIGEQLYLSVNTVKGNLKTIYRKLGVSSRAMAVDAAKRAGLV